MLDIYDKNMDESIEKTEGQKIDLQVEKLKVLLTISEGLYSARDFISIGDTIEKNLRSFQNLFQFDYKFGVYDREKDMYILIFDTGFRNPNHNKYALPLNQPVPIHKLKAYSGLVIKEKKTLIIQDSHSEYSLSIDPFQKNNLPHSMIFIPLYHDNEFLGLISFARKPINSMDNDFIEFFDSIAKYVGMAVAMVISENKRIEIENELIKNHKILEKINSELEERVVSRTIELINLNKSLENEIEKKKLSELTLRKSEANLKAILNNSQQMFLLIDKEMKVRSFNPLAYETIKENFNFKIKEGFNLFENIPSDKRDSFDRVIKSTFETGSFTREEIALTKTGKKKWYLVNYNSVKTAMNEVLGVCIGALDITERKRAEEINTVLYKISQSINSSSNIQDLFKSIHMAIAEIINVENIYIALYDKLNDSISFPYSLDEAGRNYIIERASESDSLTAELVKTEKTLLLKKPDFDARFANSKRKIIGILPKVWLGIPLKLKNEVIGALVVQSDTDENMYDESDKKFLEMVSEQISSAISQKKAHEALLISEDKFSKVFRMSPDAIAMNRLIDGIFIEINEGYKNLTGYTSEEIIGKSSRDINIWSDLEDRDKLVNSITQFGEIIGLEANFRIKNGQVRTGLLSAKLLEVNNEKYILTITRDITERKKIEEKIREQASLLNIVTDAIFVTDINDTIVFWNNGAAQILEWNQDEIIGTKIYNHIINDKDKYNIIKQDVLNNKAYNEETKLFTKTGKEIYVESRYSIIDNESNLQKSILCVMTDITEKKAIQKQYLRTQRMESLGTLASGIAHDLNNVLTPIMGSIQLLSMRNKDEKSLSLLSMLKTSVERGSQLIKQILTFARGQKEENININLIHNINDVIKILKHTFPKNITIFKNIPKNLFNIFGDPTQIHQVLLNICINAKDAMPEGGTLSIIAENTFFDKKYSTLNPTVKEGSFVVIAISDTGIGIKPEDQEKIFEPFYTTKEVGKGTGLGLSTVYTIVKNHGGFINLYSEAGKGTIFKVYLPATGTSVEKIDAEDKISLPEGNGETILIIDDENSICEITKTTLEAFNYKVITANNGTEGIAIFIERKNEISAVLVDMVMPVMDGNTTIQVIQMMKPEVKIIATSGFITNEAIFQNKNINSILMKPYSGEKLLKTLKEVLIK